jgi:hypothetical protein
MLRTGRSRTPKGVVVAPPHHSRPTPCPVVAGRCGAVSGPPDMIAPAIRAADGSPDRLHGTEWHPRWHPVRIVDSHRGQLRQRPGRTDLAHPCPAVLHCAFARRGLGVRFPSSPPAETPFNGALRTPLVPHHYSLGCVARSARRLPPRPHPGVPWRAPAGTSTPERHPPSSVDMCRVAAGKSGRGNGGMIDDDKLP